VAAGNQIVLSLSNSGATSYVSGTRMMDLTSTGLGIGASSPNTKLQVNGNVVIGNGTIGAPASGFQLRITNDNTDFYDFGRNSSTGYFISNSSQAFPYRGFIWAYGGTAQATLDASGNLGLGVTPSAWSAYKAIQTTGASFIGYSDGASNNQAMVVANAFYDSGANWKYIYTDNASRYQQFDGQHIWYNAPSGTAGDTISFTQAMTLDASGNLGIGTSGPSVKLETSTARSATVVSAIFTETGTGVVNDVNKITIKVMNTASGQTGGVGVGAVLEAVSSNRTGLALYYDAGSGVHVEGVRLDSLGNLGVGTISPLGRIDSSYNITSFEGGQFVASNVAKTNYASITAVNGQTYSVIQTFNSSVAAGALILQPSAGSVGIGGTTSPAGKLQVGANGVAIILDNVYSAASPPTTGNDQYIFRDTNDGSLNFSSRPGGGGNYKFWNGATQLAIITNAGNVGIGTSSPVAGIDIVRSAGTSTYLRTSDGSYTALFGIAPALGQALVGTTSNHPVAFYTNNTERARIDSNGTLLVGCTGGGSAGNAIVSYGSGGDIQKIWSTSASSAFASLISMFSDATTPSSPTGTLRVNITTNGGIANFQANDSNLSDRREKTNFAPAGLYLDKICAIPVQTFNYIDQNMEDDGGLTLGVVAQDVQAVAPELITESNWGTEEEPKMRLSIYQTDLQYALMKCIQEQQAIIESLKARLDAANL
jgi:hypothetical protein